MPKIDFWLLNPIWMSSFQFVCLTQVPLIQRGVQSKLAFTHATWNDGCSISVCHNFFLSVENAWSWTRRKICISVVEQLKLLWIFFGNFRQTVSKAVIFLFFKSNFSFEIGRVQDFLGLKRIVTEKYFFFNSSKGFPCLIKSEARSSPHCLGKSKGRNHPSISRNAYEQLKQFYRPHNMKFYRMTGIDFGWL